MLYRQVTWRGAISQFYSKREFISIFRCYFGHLEDICGFRGANLHLGRLARSFSSFSALWAGDVARRDFAILQQARVSYHF